MPDKTKPPIIGDAPSKKLPTSHLTKQQFGQRLYQLMVAKGWSQSDLARRAGLQRDRISYYIRGQGLPQGHKLEALAKALGVTADELLPNTLENRMEADQPSVDLKVSPNNPNAAWLRVNRLVSMTTALKILDLLNNDDPLTSGK
jgi:transcriptional regulator with XRE-family HTH domain